ncbi:MAG: hypothetical protein NTX52_09540, partial [Planctomycetota bacterium]|nr:hypothetical protein [Planctomycetota bacterium]
MAAVKIMGSVKAQNDNISKEGQTMRICRKVFTRLLLVALFGSFAVSNIAGAAIEKSDIDKKLAAIAGYERGMSR